MTILERQLSLICKIVPFRQTNHVFGNSKHKLIEYRVHFIVINSKHD